MNEETKPGEPPLKSGGSLVLTCQTCGCEFRRTPNVRTSAKYCSTTCYATSRRTGLSVELVCAWCKKTYRVTPRNATRSKYCSRVCISANSANIKRPGRPRKDPNEPRKRQGRPSVPIGTRKINNSGYVFVRVDDDALERVGGKPGSTWASEHRLVMANKLGRPLLPGENIHHINGVHGDNRPENLELWVSMQPSGQRPQDLVAFAREIIALYGDLSWPPSPAS